MPLSPRKAIELFHLVFLRALVAKNEDRGLVSLKGGCNLRFYFASVRYSEDIDLVQTSAMPIGPVLDAIHGALDHWLGKPQ